MFRKKGGLYLGMIALNIGLFRKPETRIAATPGASEEAVPKAYTIGIKTAGGSVRPQGLLASNNSGRPWWRVDGRSSSVDKMQQR